MKKLLVLLLLPAVLAGCALLRRKERPPYRKLSPAVVFELMRDNPEMLIVDLRTPEEFAGETGHLQRAKNVPLERLPYRVVDFSDYREDTFLVYCGTAACADQGMTFLVSSGFENAILLDGGIESWIRQGFKTVLPGNALGRASRTPDGRVRIRPARPDEEPAAQTEVPTELPPPPPP